MANMTFKTNILPNSNLEYNLGSTTKQWNLYGRLFTTSKDIEDSDKLIITDGNDYYSSNTTFDGTTETQYLTKKGIFASAPVESVAGMSGDVSLYTLAIGEKTYNGSENIVVTMADLGITSAMRFLGVTDTAITEGSTATTVNIISGGSLGNATASNGDVVLTQSNQIEYIYTGSEWKELGLASSYALRHHAHGNIITDGTIVSDTTVNSGDKIVITDASNKVSRSNISFGTDTTKALSNAGTWIDVNNYVLPTASSTVKGGIKVGSGLSITNEVLSANVTGVKGNAETDYQTGNVNLTAANIGAAAADHNHDSTYVNVTGDTMTGNLTIKTANNPCLNLTNTDMDTHAASLSAAENQTIYFRDKNSENNLTAYIQTTQATNGNVTLTIASRRRNAANDANVGNAINLTTSADGSASVSVSTPAGWRSALGLDGVYVKKSGDTMTGPLYINNTTDVGLNQNGALIIGTKTAENIAIDNNEIMARNNSAASNLNLNLEGGGVVIGTGGLTVRSTASITGGYVKITSNSNTVTIGSQNTSYCHFNNSASIPFYFNNRVNAVNGFNVYGTLNSFNNGSIELSGGTPFIDFHFGSTTADYTSRLIEDVSGQLKITGKLKVSTSRNGYALNAASFICDSWVRTVGATGWYNESYGGGWYMSDSTWIRNHGNKSLYMSTAIIRTDLVAGGSWIAGSHDGAFQIKAATNASAGGFFQSWFSGYTPGGSWGIGPLSGYNDLYFAFGTHTNYNNNTNTTNNIRFGSNGAVYGAVWNDYAEYRNIPEAQTENPILKPGMCVKEVGDGTMIQSTKRLERGCKIISDTYGFNIGETNECKTPIAVSGRVLVYIYEGRESAKEHIGWPVCSGPDGTVSIMTEEEEEKYPSRIVGTISEIPNYEVWGTGEVQVDGRIWIYVK